MKNTDINYDVIIIGGSFAGLQAAMTLGRALRKVLVIDDEQPCNKQTPHSHNFLTRDGETPAKINATAKAQLLRYTTVEFLNGRVDDAVKRDDLFTVKTTLNEEFTAKSLLFTTGIKDIKPAIPGFAECWGISVIHCPYCHGYEVHHQPTGILANGNDAYEFGKLIANWTNEITIFTNGPSTMKLEEEKSLQSKNIITVTDEVQEIVHEQGQLRYIVLKNGKRKHLTALYARVPFEQHCDIPARLGCELNDLGFIKVDQFGKTNVDGVFAAGDNSSMFRSIVNAVSMGAASAAFINRELISEEF